MSVKLNRPLKPEKNQKNSNFNGKTILYPGFEPGTSGLAVGSHNLCTIEKVNRGFKFDFDFTDSNTDLIFQQFFYRKFFSRKSPVNHNCKEQQFFLHKMTELLIFYLLKEQMENFTVSLLLKLTAPGPI
jgi:hypothetical protein